MKAKFSSWQETDALLRHLQHSQEQFIIQYQESHKLTSKNFRRWRSSCVRSIVRVPRVRKRDAEALFNRFAIYCPHSRVVPARAELGCEPGIALESTFNNYVLVVTVMMMTVMVVMVVFMVVVAVIMVSVLMRCHRDPAV